jgi:hypothetical protein
VIMGDHRLSPRRLVSPLGALMILVALASVAGSAPREDGGSVQSRMHWRLQSSGLEAMSIQARLSAPELRQAAHKHRSAPIWMVIAGLSLALPILLSRGELLDLMAGRPYGSSLWPFALPRAPPPLQFC